MGRKRRSCSGSRNGTPASKGRPMTVDPEVVAAAAEEAALDASLAAAEATAVTGGQTQVAHSLHTVLLAQSDAADPGNLRILYLPCR